MSAVASSAGVLSATAPGGVVVPLPFSDNFNRANGGVGSPWYRPGCRDELQIVSNTLQPTIANDQLIGLLLGSDDFDLTFDAHYSAASSGVRDDINVAFRLDACAPSTAAGVGNGGNGLLLTTNPGASGTAGMTLLSESSGSFSVVFTGGSGIVEGSTYTYRLHLAGTALSVYVNGAAFLSATVGALPSQRALQFFVTRPGSYIDNLSIISAGVLVDNFDRTNSSTTVNPASDGGSWTAEAGIWGITSNRGVLVTNAATGSPPHVNNFNLISTNTGSIAQTVIVTSVRSSTSGTSAIFVSRDPVSGVGYFVSFDSSAGGMTISKSVNRGGTGGAHGTSTETAWTGGSTRLRVKHNGSGVVTVEQDTGGGFVAVLSYTDALGGVENTTPHYGGTWCGLADFTVGPNAWDDFSVTNP